MFEVYYATETQEYEYQPKIFGYYTKMSQKVNGRNHYISEDGHYGIWWTKYTWWMIGSATAIGQNLGYAYIENSNMNSECLPGPGIIGWNWVFYSEGKWQNAGKRLGVRCGHPGKCN